MVLLRVQLKIYSHLQGIESYSFDVISFYVKFNALQKKQKKKNAIKQAIKTVTPQTLNTEIPLSSLSKPHHQFLGSTTDIHYVENIHQCTVHPDRASHVLRIQHRLWDSLDAQCTSVQCIGEYFPPL